VVVVDVSGVVDITGAVVGVEVVVVCLVVVVLVWALAAYAPVVSRAAKTRSFFMGAKSFGKQSAGFGEKQLSC
jgi:hypothetical protein